MLHLEIKWYCWSTLVPRRFQVSLKEFFESGKIPKNAGWQRIKKIVRRKLDMLDYAHTLDDLASPPGNKLEALQDDLKGLHSIRINDQWRIVFEWTNQGPAKVRTIDYH